MFSFVFGSAAILYLVSMQQFRLTSGAEKVSFSLYYESLCPYSKQFIIDQVYPTFRKLSSIMNVQLVPFSGYKTDRDVTTFNCQHGEQECKINLIQSCVLKDYPDQNINVPFVSCMEQYSNSEELASADGCANKYKIDIGKVKTCANSQTGITDQVSNSRKVQMLKPTLAFFPWITIDGVHNDDIQMKARTKLYQLICDSYKGAKIPACGATVVPKPIVNPMADKSTKIPPSLLGNVVQGALGGVLKTVGLEGILGILG